MTCYIKYKDNLSIMPVSKTNIIIDSDILDKDILYKQIAKTYYFNQEPPQFSDIGFTSSYPNLYNMYWTLKMAVNLNYDLSSVESDRYEEFIFCDETFHELTRIEYQIGICGILHIPIDESKINYFRDRLLSYYDQESLFFFHDTEDTIETKLGATRNIIDLYRNLDIPLDYKEEILYKVLSLYNDDSFFDISNGLENSMLRAGIICQILNRFDLSVDKLDTDSTKRVLWLKQMNEYFSDDQNHGIIFYKILSETNQFFGNQLHLKPENLKEVKEKILIIEPQLLTYTIEMYNYYNYDFEYTKDVIYYIDDAINSEFNKFGTVSENLEDNYYGICLANIFGYNYDQNRMKNYLKQKYEQTFLENSCINDYKKLRELYYLMSSLKEYNINIQKGLLNRLVIEFLDKINSNNVYNDLSDVDDEKKYELISTYNLCLKMFDLINESCPVEHQNRIISFLKEIDQDKKIYNIMYMWVFIETVNMLETEELGCVKESIESEINKLSVNGGYKYLQGGVSGRPSIPETYIAVQFKKHNGGLELEKAKEIKKYLKNYYTFDPKPGLRRMPDAGSLWIEELYYTLLLCHEINIMGESL